MVACLERIEENAEFYQIVDFLSTCSINYALTISPTIYASYIEQFWNTATSKKVNSVKQIHAIVNGKAVEISSGDRPRHQETTLRGADAQTRFETASKKSCDPPLSEVNTSGSEEDIMEHTDDLMNFVSPTPHDLPLSRDHTPRSDEDRPNLLELMNIYTQLSNRVLALEEAKTTQDKVITRLKLRVRRLEKKRKARTSQPMKRRLFKGRVETSTDKSLGEDASKQRMNDDKIEEINLTDGADTEVIVEDKGSGEKTLIKLRSEKAKVKGVAFKDVKEPPRLTRSTTTLQHLPTIDPKDKAKDLAQRIYEEELAKLDRAQKENQKQKEATIVALTEEFDEIQARMDANHELAIRMTYEEQENIQLKKGQDC
nr:hypothetical protein [Tanacetum cinerariifolium]